MDLNELKEDAVEQQIQKWRRTKEAKIKMKEKLQNLSRAELEKLLNSSDKIQSEIAAELLSQPQNLSKNPKK